MTVVGADASADLLGRGLCESDLSEVELGHYFKQGVVPDVTGTVPTTALDADQLAAARYSVVPDDLAAGGTKAMRIHLQG
jgi:hypothetical protein